MPFLVIHRNKTSVGRDFALKRMQGDPHRRVLMLKYPEGTRHSNPHSKFLFDFADDRFRRTLALLDFAARELPHPRKVGIAQKAPGHQHTTGLVWLPDEGTDNVDPRFFRNWHHILWKQHFEDGCNP